MATGEWVGSATLQKLPGLISLYTNAVSISSAPVQTVPLKPLQPTNRLWQGLLSGT
jgi:hypothetical protein